MWPLEGNRRAGPYRTDDANDEAAAGDFAKAVML
jgi:hypothetical protein